MKTSPLALAAVICSVLLLMPHTAKALSVTLDDPNQTVSAPPSGITTLTFSGTVVVDTFFQLNAPTLDNPTNSSNSDVLTATLNSAFVSFAETTFGGTYTGNLFSVDVPTGTPADLYAIFFGSVPSTLTVNEFTAGGSVDMASAPFSVTVTTNSDGGNAVPETGATLLLLGASLGALFVARGILGAK